MFREKYAVDPSRLAVWLSIYLVTVIPGYHILYENAFYFFIMVIVIQETMFKFVLKENMIPELYEALDSYKRFMIAVSGTILTVFLIQTFFHDLVLFIFICALKGLFFGLKQFVMYFRLFIK